MSSELETALPSGTKIAAAADMALARPAPPRLPALEADRIVARDGAVLPLKSWRPAGAPTAIVLALHGFNDYSNAFADTGETFAAAGIATYAYDQRGFGQAPLRGRWAGTTTLVDDAIDAMALLRRRYPGVPLYLMGESMGGAVAVLASVRMGDAGPAPDGVILAAPAVWGRATMNLFERAGLWFADLMPEVRWSPALIPVRIRASDNIRMLRALGEDPMVIKATRSDAINGLVDLMGEALEAAPRYRANSLILYGERDEIVPRQPVERFVAQLPREAAAQQRVALYAEGYHLLTRDLEGPKVVADMLSWIERPGAPLPSGADLDARARLAGTAAPATTPRGNQASTIEPALRRAPS
jgi:alpha-beta hydrolase superfamily lysophospholipase